MTNASSAYSMTTAYTELGKVLVGNGSALHIYAIGNLVIPTQSKPLNLNNLLYTPSTTKNPLFMSHLTKDN